MLAALPPDPLTLNSHKDQSAGEIPRGRAPRLPSGPLPAPSSSAALWMWSTTIKHAQYSIRRNARNEVTRCPPHSPRPREPTEQKNSAQARCPMTPSQLVPAQQARLHPLSVPYSVHTTTHGIIPHAPPVPSLLTSAIVIVHTVALPCTHFPLHHRRPLLCPCCGLHGTPPVPCCPQHPRQANSSTSPLTTPCSLPQSPAQVLPGFYCLWIGSCATRPTAPGSGSLEVPPPSTEWLPAEYQEPDKHKSAMRHTSNAAAPLAHPREPTNRHQKSKETPSTTVAHLQFQAPQAPDTHPPKPAAHQQGATRGCPTTSWSYSGVG